MTRVNLSCDQMIHWFKYRYTDKTDEWISVITKRFTDSITDQMNNKWVNLSCEQMIHWFKYWSTGKTDDWIPVKTKRFTDSDTDLMNEIGENLDRKVNLACYSSKIHLNQTQAYWRRERSKSQSWLEDSLSHWSTEWQMSESFLRPKVHWFRCRSTECHMIELFLWPNDSMIIMPTEKEANLDHGRKINWFNNDPGANQRYVQKIYRLKQTDNGNLHNNHERNSSRHGSDQYWFICLSDSLVQKDWIIHNDTYLINTTDSTDTPILTAPISACTFSGSGMTLLNEVTFSGNARVIEYHLSGKATHIWPTVDVEHVKHSILAPHPLKQ